MKTKPVLILASTSPRRIELMTQVGLRPVVMAPDADETHDGRESPAQLVERLARLKAESMIGPVSKRYDSALIVAADTIVVAPDGKTIFGKPSSVANARKMLKLMQAHTHTVLTGYCILRVRVQTGAKKKTKVTTREIVRVVTSKVTFRALSSADIQRYVASGEPMDKAGAYAAQGRGTALIESIEGSYTNVVGLPMAELLNDLEQQFGMGLFEPDRYRK